MEVDDALYQKQQEEKTTRKDIKIATEVQGIGKKEQAETLLRSDEKFTEIL